MVQIPKRNLPTAKTLSLTEKPLLAEVQSVAVKTKVKTNKSCRQGLVENIESSLPVQPIATQADVTSNSNGSDRKPWGRSRSFDEPTERIPIALPITLTQALRLKAVMLKKTPSQIIADLLRSHL